MKLINIKQDILFKERSRNLDRQSNILNMSFVAVPLIGTTFTNVNLLNIAHSMAIEKTIYPFFWTKLKDADQETIALFLYTTIYKIYKVFYDTAMDQRVNPLTENATYEEIRTWSLKVAPYTNLKKLPEKECFDKGMLPIPLIDSLFIKLFNLEVLPDEITLIEV